VPKTLGGNLEGSSASNADAKRVTAERARKFCQKTMASTEVGVCQGGGWGDRGRGRARRVSGARQQSEEEAEKRG
jgi:aspartate/methionine/tyrosine aminotransferase